MGRGQEWMSCQGRAAREAEKSRASSKWTHKDVIRKLERTPPYRGNIRKGSEMAAEVGRETIEFLLLHRWRGF